MEVLPNPDQGIIELVKNSYDADATECTVEVVKITTIGGSIIISDNGIGMDQDPISEGWLVLGRSKKAVRELTPLGLAVCSSCGEVVKKTLSTRTHVCKCGCLRDFQFKKISQNFL